MSRCAANAPTSSANVLEEQARPPSRTEIDHRRQGKPKRSRARGRMRRAEAERRERERLEAENRRRVEEEDAAPVAPRRTPHRVAEQRSRDDEARAYPRSARRRERPTGEP